MRAFISGGFGFVGRAIAQHLAIKGFSVTIADKAQNMNFNNPSIEAISADTTIPGSWQKLVERADLIVNLAGSSIFGRWTAKRKKDIYESRIATTKNIVDAIPDGKPVTLFSTSAQGYYGFRNDELLDEDAGPGFDFLARVCIDWEKEAHRASAKGARVVITRFGIILGKHGGVLGIMEPLFKLFLGGKLGKGNQWFSWIHIDDLINAYFFLLDNSTIVGPVNVCAPNAVTNAEFTRILGKVLNRPTIFPLPSFLVKILLGEFGKTLLKGQRAFPKKLLEAGFTFAHPTIESALQNLYGIR
ncbi:MAG: TIGR01777 family oxidoreductase [Spirochaetes bacterium]|nr:TIGR01777 family oxidoreductase [Spirochaetota bacterium]